MKKTFILFLFACLIMQMQAADVKTIRIGTNDIDLVLQVPENGRLYQVYLGEKLKHKADLQLLSWRMTGLSNGSTGESAWEVYGGQGGDDYFDNAIAVMHPDGNPSTYLYYVSSNTTDMPGGKETTILLRDDQYPLEVTLHYQAYEQENIIKTWSEIKNGEKKHAVTLSAMASTMLHFSNTSYYLTEFSSSWAREANLCSQQLQPGKKILDSKMGSRAAIYMNPHFEVGLGQPVQEQQGTVLMGSIGWTGNYRYTFEIDDLGNLRVIPGINPTASHYELAAGQTLKTPDFIFTLSQHGTSQGSRNFHDWARRYQLRNGMDSRYVLLNNWENTYFSFDEALLIKLMKEAKELGVDLFLLDDGWFGTTHPRNDDHAGLGDWEVNPAKLPNGTKALTDAAAKEGVKFGIWIEPEMVNPKSRLFETHPDWAIQLPNRKPFYYRNQQVLDLSNPVVQDYVFGIIDNLMKDNPAIAFMKWDCNAPIVNIYSPYMGSKKQNNLYIEHVKGVYNVMRRAKETYPNLTLMLCSGGGARCDFEALKYFTEFWCSDNTDPVDRLYIQWGFSQFMPAKAMCAHVTNWDRTASVKYRVDVASMCKLGFDIGLTTLSADELTLCKQAINNWRRLQPSILDGDQYRLISPFETNHMAVNYVSKDRRQAVLFAYDLHPRYDEKVLRVCLQGLNADARYRIEEINLMPGVKSRLVENGQVFTGDYLMKIGLPVLSATDMRSKVIELNAVE